MKSNRFCRCGVIARVVLLLGVCRFLLSQFRLLAFEKEVGNNSNSIGTHFYAGASPNQPHNTTANTIAHVVTLIQCDNSEATTGYIDGAAVLLHSIQLQSKKDGSMTYQPRMYAIVHEDCAAHPSVASLQNVGYETLIRPSPVQLSDIKPGWYRDNVELENCCGSKEFIKLYAYTLTDHPIFVLWDLDTILLKPMDILFDAMLHSEESSVGKLSRSQLQLQHPEISLPGSIDAFFTNDITSAEPWEKHQGVQGGFLVARPSQNIFDQYLKIIKTADYVPGRGNDKGWGGLGYGGFQGAMAFQGIVAYYYGQTTSNAVELDVCIWNQVVADVIWRGPHNMSHYGECRSHPRAGDSYSINTPAHGRCKDCRSVEHVMSAHFTACKKPWDCIMRKERGKMASAEAFQQLTNSTTCRLLFNKWFDVRKDLEDNLEKNGIPPSDRDGEYRPDAFKGYCRGPNKVRNHYIPMNLPPDNSVMKTMMNRPNLKKQKL